MKLRTLRFLRGFARSARDEASEHEMLFDVAGQPRPATLYSPPHDGRSPIWIILHGAAVPGRHHEGVRRLARGLAAAGHVAFVPEIPDWTELRVRPDKAVGTLRAVLKEIANWPDVDPDRFGLAGLSVAGTWCLAAATHLDQPPRCILGLGGYADFGRTVRAMITGEHEWRGTDFRHRPDPYGRWIVAGDLLPLLEGDEFGSAEDRQAAADALRSLAHTAGRNGALAWSSIYDRLIGELTEALPAGALKVWRLLTPLASGPPPNLKDQAALARALAEAGLRHYPILDPARSLAELESPVVLIHGRDDTLIPFTETLRLAAMLPDSVEVKVLITRLVGHAKTRTGPPLCPGTSRVIPGSSRGRWSGSWKRPSARFSA